MINLYNMVRSEKNKEMFERWKYIVNAVFAAEHKLYDILYQKVEAREITPDEYVDAIVDEILSMTDESEIN